MKRIIEDEECKMPLDGGHGLGLDVVEIPILTVTDQTEILPGMVLVLHPSVFMPGFGGVFYRFHLPDYFRGASTFK